jgi:ribonucleotide monophosphatase NagD (HAD superfamily)
MVEDGRALDGAVDTVVRARHHGLVNHFVTNTARRHHHDLLQELSGALRPSPASWPPPPWRPSAG